MALGGHAILQPRVRHVEGCSKGETWRAVQRTDVLHTWRVLRNRDEGTAEWRVLEWMWRVVPRERHVEEDGGWQ